MNRRAVGLIYIARSGDRIKVGFTTRPLKRRVVDLLCERFVKDSVEIVAAFPSTYSGEREVHACLAAHNDGSSQRTEIYHPHPEVLAWVDAVRASHPISGISAKRRGPWSDVARIAMIERLKPQRAARLAAREQHRAGRSAS